MFILVFDDGEAFGPFDSAEEAVRADIHHMATAKDVLPEYAARARTLDSIDNWSVPSWSVYSEDWFKAVELVKEVDHIIFSTNMVVGNIDDLWPELKNIEDAYVFGAK